MWKWFKKHHWQIVLASILVSFALGFWGYLEYYRMTCESVYDSLDGHGEVKIWIEAFLSTTKLYGGGWGVSISSGLVDGAKDLKKLAFVVNCLYVARILALIPTGIAIFKTLKALLPRVWSKARFLYWKSVPRELCLFIGYNQDNVRLYTTSPNKEGSLILCEAGKDTTYLHEEGFHYYSPANDKAMEAIVSLQLAKVLKHPDRRITLVINTESEEINLHMCKTAVSVVKEAVENINSNDIAGKRTIVEMLERIRIVAMGDKTHEELYHSFEQMAYGTMKYTNRCHIASFDFVSTYPMTKYLKDVKNGCVDKEAGLNVIFVGFGDTNREIFQDFFTVNQYIFKEENRIPQLKQVHYHIIDHDENAFHEKNLNHAMFNYIDDFVADIAKNPSKKDMYLELPACPIKHEFILMDIEAPGFYDKIKEICREPDSVNYVVISFGDDFNNLDLAQRLAAKKNEWEEDFHIFVKVRKSENGEIARVLSKEREGYVTFGNESLSFNRLVFGEVEEIAYRRKRMTLKRDVDGKEKNGLSNDTVKVLYSWYTMHPFMRQSSLYNILALRMKLQLIGLDYVKEGKDDAKGISQQEYFGLYARGCEPVKTHNPESFRGAMYDYEDLTYPEDYQTGLTRRNMCVQEHYRWNAYMIRCGFVPPARKEVEGGFVKDYGKKRRHANITSFEALFEFREIMARVKGTALEKEDVIGYDYKLMDEAWFFLNESGYRIVRRQS